MKMLDGELTETLFDINRDSWKLETKRIYTLQTNTVSYINGNFCISLTKFFRPMLFLTFMFCIYKSSFYFRLILFQIKIVFLRPIMFYILMVCNKTNLHKLVLWSIAITVLYTKYLYVVFFSNNNFSYLHFLMNLWIVINEVN